MMTHLDQYYRLGMVGNKTTYGHFGLYIENMYLPDNNKSLCFCIKKLTSKADIKYWKSRVENQELEMKS